MHTCNIAIINVKILPLNEEKLILDMFLSRISTLDDRVLICFFSTRKNLFKLQSKIHPSTVNDFQQ